MIEIKDLKKGLRVRGKNFKGIIVDWDIQKGFTIPQLTLPAVHTKTIAHVHVNTVEGFINSPRQSDRDVITWGATNTKLDVDLDYYDNIRNNPQPQLELQHG